VSRRNSQGPITHGIELPSLIGLSRPAAVAAIRAFHRAAWDAARAHHDAGASGGNVVRALSDAADSIVTQVAAYVIAGTGVHLDTAASLCALGGYGRGELSPCSDLDLCLLHDALPAADLEAFSSAFVTFLWDAHLKPGYVTHSVDEAHALAQRDPEVYTAYVQARPLLGDDVVLARLDVLLASVRVAQADAIVRHVDRRDHSRELPLAYRDLYSPEPDLKESAGGLRDAHAAQWMFAVKYGNVGLEDLVRLGALKEDELLPLLEGRDFLWRVRNEMHFHYHKPGNQLTFAAQRHTAQAFGYGPDSPDTVGRFMRDYYAAARKLRNFLHIAARQCQQSVEPDVEPPAGERRRVIRVRRGMIILDVDDPNWFAENPSRLMEVFWHCARLRKPLHPDLERAVRENIGLIGGAFRTSDLVRNYFLAICSRPLQAGFALRQAAQAGVLGAYLPEFNAIQDIIRYEDFHSFPVDEHTLRAMEALTQLDQMEGHVARVLQETLDHVREPHILLLAILCHDLGKAEGETHVEEGVRLVHNLGERIGLDADTTERVAFLVQHHMLMSNIGLYRNTDDPDVINAFAETMKSDERLRELLLLTFADMSAVGPNVWTEWKGALLLKLYLRAERYLLGRSVTLDEQFWTLPKADDVRALLPAELRDQVEPHLRDLREQYFFAFSAARMAQHIECLAEARRTGLSVRWLDVPHTEMNEVVVCTRDHRRLFAEITGSFTAMLADVHSASLFTTPDGYVVDVFLVTDAAQKRPLTENQLRGVESVLHAVIDEGKDIQDYVDRSRKRLFALTRPRMPFPSRITFDNEASRTDTIIDIEAPDRTGLLFDMGSALAAAGVDVRTARIVTDARRVRDAFYVQRDGQKLVQDEELTQIRDGLAAAVRGMMPAGSTGEIA
jgi:[protein-PII] uridylyltransferase